MHEITLIVEKKLKAAAVTEDRFRQILVRLLGRGIIVYGDSQVENELYNDAIRAETLIGDYFSVMGATVRYEHSFKYIRLYPPGAHTDGSMEDEEHVDASLRESLSQHEIAAVLILRFLYDQQLQEGRLDDDAEARITMEALHTALQTRLKRGLPDKSTERKNLFKKLKRYKLIKYTSDDDLEQPETMLVIRPMLVGFVSADAIASLGATETVDASTEELDHVP